MDKPSLPDVFGRYGIAVRDGGRRNQLVLCPVHSEDRPSCSVNAEEGLWNCKACGARGDAWTLIMTKEGLDFAGAIAFAEKEFGVVPGARAGTGRIGLSGKQGAGRGYRPKVLRRGISLP